MRAPGLQVGQAPAGPAGTLEPGDGSHHPDGYPRRLHRQLLPPGGLSPGRTDFPGAPPRRGGPARLLPENHPCGV